MTADWTGCFLLTCVTVSSVQLPLSTKLTQQVAVNTQVPQPNSYKQTHTHTANAHLSIDTRTHRSTRITVKKRLGHHDWLSNPHTCANNFLSPEDKGEGRRRKKERNKEKKTCGRWWRRYRLFIYMGFSEGNKAEGEKRFYFLLSCRDDRFIVSIKKKRIFNKVPCLIAIEKL